MPVQGTFSPFRLERRGRRSLVKRWSQSRNQAESPSPESPGGCDGPYDVEPLEAWRKDGYSVR
jgi:hypothetical protein